MAKGDTRFANVEAIVRAADDVFGGLRRERLLRGLGDQTYAERLAHYYSEVNILHPFREGNGRAQRAFFELLAGETGRHLAWERVTPEQNLAAVVAAYEGNEAPLAELLGTALEPARLRGRSERGRQRGDGLEPELG
jgi:cell filamentation protein